MVQGDVGNTGLAFALVAPAATIWVAAASDTAQWPEEAWAVSGAGAYVATVLVNQLTGLRSLRKRRAAASVVPHPSGGASVWVAAQF